MVGSPNGKDGARKPGHIAQKEAATVVRSKRRDTLIASRSPTMGKMPAQWKTNDMDDAQTRW